LRKSKEFEVEWFLNESVKTLKRVFVFVKLIVVVVG